MARAEVIAIGNELLQGDVLDTNTHWLCRQLTGRGARVERGALVRDEPVNISEAVHGALSRGSDLIILSGGLGPTSDDLTLAALAEAVDRPLRLDGNALRMVEATYRDLAVRGLVQDGSLTEARRKMAYLPQGAEPLANAVGAAPGVLLRLQRSVIVCLPGVPEELRCIFVESLSPRLAGLLGQLVFDERVVVTDCGDESVLAPVVDRVAESHPEVYVKSRAKAYAEGVQLRVTLSTTGTDALSVKRVLDTAYRDLERGLAEADIAIVAAEQM